MRNNRIFYVTMAAVFAALTFVFTMFVNVRLPIAANGGLVHLGNVPLFIGAILFRKKVGAFAGGVGMALFDLLSGWTLWAPFTFFIVGAMGYTVGAVAERKQKLCWYGLSMAAALIIKVVGYYIAEGIIYGNFAVPVSSVPGNLVQVCAAIIIVMPVILPLKAAADNLGVYRSINRSIRKKES